LNKKNCTAACLLDVEKAFDKVWTKGLIRKLADHSFSLPLIKIILSFLSNRTFQVKVHNSLSTSAHTTSGVLQGSVLAPHIFNIFTADIPACSSVTNQQFYADDAIVFAHSIDPIAAIKKVNQQVEVLKAYYSSWGIKINMDKSQLIVFRPPRVKGASTLSTKTFQMAGSMLTPARSIKYLGVTFSANFKFNDHIANVLRKANFAYCLISPLLRHKALSTNCKVLMY